MGNISADILYNKFNYLALWLGIPEFSLPEKDAETKDIQAITKCML